MDPKSVFKVGFVVLLALALFAGGYLFLAHLNPNAYPVRVTFANTQGLQRQSVVRLEGVAIGEVRDIKLDTTQHPPRPIVTLAIGDQYDIPADSTCHIASSLLIQNPQIEVVPGTSTAALPKDGTAQLRSGPPPSPLETASPELHEMVVKLNRSVDNLNAQFNNTAKKLNQVLDRTNQILVTANQAATSAKDLIADPRIKSSLLTTVSNFKDVSQDARTTTHQLGRELQNVVHASSGTLQKLSDRLLDLLPRIETTIDDANTVVKKLTEQVTDPRFQQSLQETAELARTTLARFSQIASDLHQITGDPTLQTSIKQTVVHLDAVTTQGAQTLEKVNNLLDKLNGPRRAPHLPPIQLVSNVSEQMNPGRLRVDLEARVGQLLNIGFYDLGQTTRLTLQGMSPLSSTLMARYGLYASKLGAGLDYAPTSVVGFRADLWDTNHPRLDVKALFKVHKDASVFVGGENLMRQPYPVIGVQIQH